MVILGAFTYLFVIYMHTCIVEETEYVTVVKKTCKQTPKAGRSQLPDDGKSTSLVSASAEQTDLAQNKYSETNTQSQRGNGNKWNFLLNFCAIVLYLSISFFSICRLESFLNSYVSWFFFKTVD